MKVKRSLVISLLLVAAAVFIMGCSENSLSGPAEPAQTAGIHVDDIQWVSAKPEFAEKMTSLKKFVTDGELITTAEGGAVGGESTLNNAVVFPKGAVDEDTYVTVTVKYNKKHFFYVEFLPSGTFNELVDVTLSWAYLDIDESSIEDLMVYFSQEGRFWFPVESEMTIDFDAKTVTFKIDHFTRFGWGI